jgi:hypothetical protein
MLEPIDGVSFELSGIHSLKTAKETTTISVVKPEDEKPSSPPLNTQGGRYKIACPDLNDPDTIYRTNEIDIYSGATTVDDSLQRYIPWMPFNVRVSMPRAGYPSDKNGFQIAIYMQDFDGFKGEIP